MLKFFRLPLRFGSWRSAAHCGLYDRIGSCREGNWTKGAGLGYNSGAFMRSAEITVPVRMESTKTAAKRNRRTIFLVSILAMAASRNPL